MASVVVVEGEESELVRPRRRSWARLIARTWLENPGAVPLLHQGDGDASRRAAKLLAAISSAAQDDVIERILRARGQWPSGPALRAGLRARLSGPTASRCPAPSELFAFVLHPRSDSASSVASLLGDDDGPIDAAPPDEADLQGPGVPEDTRA